MGFELTISAGPTGSGTTLSWQMWAPRRSWRSAVTWCAETRSAP